MNTLYVVTFFLFCSDGHQFFSKVGPMNPDRAEAFYAAFTDDPYTFPYSNNEVECKFDFVQIKEYRHKI